MQMLPPSPALSTCASLSEQELLHYYFSSTTIFIKVNRIIEHNVVVPIISRCNRTQKMSRNNDNGGNNENERSNTSSSPSRPLLGKEIQDQLKAREDEQLLFARFKNVAADSLERLSGRVEKRYDSNGGDNLQLGDEEKCVLGHFLRR
jgi:hypothetical protein